VKYVGDETCAVCHADIMETYRKHPMGQALAPLDASAPWFRFDQFDHSPRSRFQAQGFEYEVERRGKRFIHKELRRNAKGEVVAQVEAEVAYVLGSGTRGHSFLVNRDGYLFQSPISWYSGKRRWDLAPGYQEHNRHFERGIQELCLYCHSNGALPVEHTLNRYRPPVFQGYTIGCERCHGPGELHAQDPKKVGGVDYSIVNPKHLEPSLREAVCQQCHLQGKQSILRAGRKFDDYRPGLPLHLVRSVFVLPRQFTDNYKAVGQVEQMYASRCFQQSAGEMGCVTCHDPHRKPAPEEETAFYRGRCLTCHKGQDCRLPEKVRRQASKGDSCVQCHMPRRQASDVAHTALTDHRILRRPEKTAPPPDGPVSLGEDESPLLHFHRDLADPRHKGLARDLGVALTKFANEFTGHPDLQRIGEFAFPLLKTVERDAPGDVTALTAKAKVLLLLRQPDQAQAVLEQALARAPRSEMALHDAAMLAAWLRQPDRAVTYFRRLVQVNPQLSDYHAALARAYADRREWAEAGRECRKALELNPAHLEARRLLVICLTQLGEKKQAKAQFQTLLAFDPPNRAALQDWFARLGDRGG
jgi:Flp pilus assembly protein TadD